MGSLIFLVPLLLVAWLFWSQRKRQQQMRAAQDQIEIGQEIATTSGLLGTLVALDEHEGTIEVSPGVQLRFVRRAIVPREQVGGASAAAAETQEEPHSGDDSGAEHIDLDKHDDDHTHETKAE